MSVTLLLVVTIGLAVALFALAAVGLAVGVILGKRTPLKEPCHGRNRDQTGHACPTCTCVNEE